METAHVLPGRLRLRAPVLIGQRRAADQLQQSLARVDGIRTVEVNALSGSLLIHFSPDRVKPDMLLGATIRLLGLEKDILRPPRSYLGEEIRQAGEALNRAIHRAERWSDRPVDIAGPAAGGAGDPASRRRQPAAWMDAAVLGVSVDVPAGTEAANESRSPRP